MRVIKKISDFIYIHQNQSSNVKFALGIATTSFDIDEPYFSFPKHIKNWGYYIHVVCGSSHQGSTIISDLHSCVDEIFLDMEPKKKEFSSHNITSEHPSITFHKIYPNCITVQATLDLIDKNSDKRPLLFGHGDIVLQLATALRSRGINFNWCPSRLSSSKKYQRMAQSFSDLKVAPITKLHGMVVNCCAYNSDTFQQLLYSSDVRIIDVVGKGHIDETTLKNVSVVDVSARIVSEISFIVMGNKFKNNRGQSIGHNNNILTSGGYIGRSGDLVVDCHTEPSYVIGISDGRGGFLKRINEIYQT